MISRKLEIGCSFKYNELRLAIEHVDILAMCCASNIIFCVTSASLRMSYLKSVVNCLVFLRSNEPYSSDGQTRCIAVKIGLALRR